MSHDEGRLRDRSGDSTSLPVKPLLKTTRGHGRNTMVRVAHVNLAGPFSIIPVMGPENCDTRLQEGKIVGMGNQKAKTDQFKRSFR